MCSSTKDLLASARDVSAAVLATADTDSEEKRRQWTRQVAHLLDQWVGLHLLRSSSHHQRFSQALDREFGELLPHLQGLSRHADVLASCPRVSIQVLGSRFDVKPERLRFKVAVTGTTEQHDLDQDVFLDGAANVMLELSVYKIKKKKSDSLLGKACKYLSEIKSGVSIWLPVRQGKTDVGSVKVLVTSHNLTSEPLAKKLPEAIKDCLKEILVHYYDEDKEVLASLDTLKDTVHYTVVVERDEASGYLLHRNEQHRGRIVRLPLQDLACDPVTLVAVQRTSNTVFSHPKGDDVDHVCHVYAYQVPWTQELTVSQGETLWRIRLEAQQEDLGGLVSVATTMNCLYEKRLRHLTDHELDLWDGSLGKDLGVLAVALTRPVFPRTLHCVEEARCVELVKLRRKYKFSHGIMHELLLSRMKANGGLSSLAAELSSYRDECLATVASVGRLRDAVMAARNLNLMIKPRKKEDLETLLQLTICKHVVSLNSSALLEFIRDKILPLTRSLNAQKELIMWADILSRVTLKAALDRVAGLLTDDEAMTEKLYLTYVSLRELLLPLRSTELEESFYSTFQPLLPRWAALTVAKASEQVARVVDLERRNLEEDVQEDWLDGTVLVTGIFGTCLLTWRELSWPRPVEHTRFGTQVLQGLRKVFLNYVDEMLSLAISHQFERRQLVLALQSAVEGAKYLKDAGVINALAKDREGNFTTFGNSKRSSAEEREAMREFSDVFAAVTLEADDEAERVVETFVEGQRKLIEKFIAEEKIVTDDDDDDEALLPYLASLFKYVSVHLRSEDKFLQMLCSDMLKLVEAEVAHEFERRKSRRAPPEAFGFLLRALPALLFFAGQFSEDFPVLKEINRDLYPLSATSAQLISTLMRSPALLSHEKCGTIILKAGFVEQESRVVVNVIGLNVVPRDAKVLPSFSLTLSVLPLNKDPYIQRRKTPSFDRTTTVDLKSTFVFALPTNAYHQDECMLSVELYYHIPYGIKVFGGVAPPFTLAQMPSLKEDYEIRYVDSVTKPFLRLCPDGCNGSIENSELQSRKDPLAKLFVSCFERQRLGKTFFEVAHATGSNSNSQVEEEAAVSNRFIAEHVEELREHYATHTKREESCMLVAKLAFNECTEELLCELDSVVDLNSLVTDEKHLNLSLAVRVLPPGLKVKESRTKVYPGVSTTLHFCEADQATLRLSLRPTSYNYHATFVHLLLFDNARPSILSSRGERVFIAHALLALSDIHPTAFHDVKFAASSVAKRKIPFSRSLKLHDSSTVDSLRGRSDRTAKEYVQALDRLRDHLPEKISHSKGDWLDSPPGDEAVLLIARHLEKVVHEQRSDTTAHNGVLRFQAQLPSQDRSVLGLELRSIAEISPLDESSPVNFSVSIFLLPESGGKQKTRSTQIFYGRNSLLFDLEDVPSSNFEFEVDHREALVCFELFLHHGALKHFRGCFFMLMDSTEDSEMRQGHFRLLPEADTNELVELENRKADAVAKRFVRWYNRRRDNKVALSFNFSLHRR